MPRDAELAAAAAYRSPRWNGPRFRSLTISLMLHSAAVFALLSGSGENAAFFQPSPEEQIFELKPERIIWYPLKEIPKISPDNSTDKAEIKAEKLSSDVLIHNAPDAAHDNRLVWRAPDRKDAAPPTPVPDMIAVARGADAPVRPEPQAEAPPPPAPPKPAPKAFVAPAAPPSAVKAAIKIEEPPPLVDQPKLPVADSSLSELTSGNKVKYLRRFVPPPPNQQAKNGEGAKASFVPDAPTVQGAGGTSDINALIINTMRGPAINPSPPRASSISTGPVKGPGVEGGGKGDLQAPGVVVIPKTPETEASLKAPRDPFKGSPAPGATAPQPYIATRIAPLEHTLSAPLRPSSRSIPNLIEKRFSGRVVYTILLPMKGLPGYAGDWTLWFAERQPADPASTGAPMRAPLPVRKPVRADVNGHVITNGIIQLSAILDKTGKVGSVSVIGGSDASAAAAVSELESWDFLPALRNREPVEVDIIVEIPFGINQQPLPSTRVPVPSGVDSVPPTNP